MRRILLFLGCTILLLAVSTWLAMKPVPPLQRVMAECSALQARDRNNYPLSISYQNRWNRDDTVALHTVPEVMKQAFMLSEDKRFYQHNGIDWQARGSALWQNISSRKTVRGASTISEQVVRMLHPRPRSQWSKWVEGFEALALEQGNSKAEILEFYLNQLPYASNRRGVVQAARYYFNRDLSSLSQQEMLGLVVLARAPSGYDLYKRPKAIEAGMLRLANVMHIPVQGGLKLEPPKPQVNTAHFLQFARMRAADMGYAEKNLKTTLDAALQIEVQNIVDERVRALAKKQVHNTAALVVDHHSGEILAWVVAGADGSAPGYRIDAVTVPRQPGSSMKSFLYTQALEKNWTAATIIEDAPMAEAIGNGLHRFKNYSHAFYGNVTLREALGNSLNIPALKAVRHVGTTAYLKQLHRLGFASLNRSAEIYDEGLALGNGEVTLYELVQGYAALANRGVWQSLRVLQEEPLRQTRVYSEEAASLIGNILSDPWARRLEFGNNSVLNLPVQTAAKTGTSTDYRDAWAVAYNDQYVVGMWMGNLDHTPMDGVTGSTGPALAVRSIFARLNRNRDTAPLYLSPRLAKREICPEDHEALEAKHCIRRTEYFMAGTGLTQTPPLAVSEKLEVVRPTDGLEIAFDPRIPADKQRFPFTISGVQPGEQVQWILNGQPLGSGASYPWPVQRGRYRLRAAVNGKMDSTHSLPEIHFQVK